MLTRSMGGWEGRRDTMCAVEGATRRASGAWRRLADGRGGTVGTVRCGTLFEGEAADSDTMLSMVLCSWPRDCCFLGLLVRRSHSHAWKG